MYRVVMQSTRHAAALRALTLGTSLLMSSPVLVRADAPAPSAEATTPSVGADARPLPQSAGPFAVAIQEGLGRLRQGDAQAAQIAFQRAVAADRAQPDGHYFLGIAMRRNNSLPSAVDAFHESLQKAQQGSNLPAEGRARMALAQTLSAIGNNRQADAGRAWNELMMFAQANPSVVAPEIPRSYIEAVERVAALETAMAPVRTRIRARENEARNAPTGGSARGAHH